MSDAEDAPASVRAPNGGDVWFGLFLFLLALAPRVYVATAWAGEAVWDGHYYEFGARRIAAGLGYSDDIVIDGKTQWHPWCHYPVGYSGFLALFFRIFGSGTHVAPTVGACVGAVLAVVSWLLARHALPPWRARLAGLLVALHPGLILYAGCVMTEPLAAALTLMAFWLAVREPERPGRGVVPGALVLGLATLVRPTALLSAPFLALALPRPEGARKFVHYAAGAVVVTLLTLAPVFPWTARNCRVMDGCALVSTNTGWNLAIGAFPRATGRFETLRSSDGCREVTGQVQQDRCWFAYGLAQIRANPARWIGLVPAKLSQTFDHESFPVAYLAEARPDRWPEPRRTLSRDGLTVFHRVLLGFAVLACVAVPRRRNFGLGPVAPQVIQLVVAVLLMGLALFATVDDRHFFWPLVVALSVLPWLPILGRPEWPTALRLPLLALATTVATHAVFFGEDRYHVVVTPVFCLLAAAALRPQNRDAAPVG